MGEGPQVIDDAIYSVEKIIVTVFSVIMVLSVFVAVTWTTLASPNSKLAFIFAGSDDAEHAWSRHCYYLVAGRLYPRCLHRDGRGSDGKKVGLGSVVAGLSIGVVSSLLRCCQMG